MFQTRTTKTTDPVGEVTTLHLEGSIVETTYRGVATRQLVQSVLDITPELLDQVPRASWLLDLTQVKSTDSHARIPGAELLKIFRDRGGREFALAVESSGLRMLLSAVGFATGMPIKMFATRDEALAYLRAREPVGKS